MRAPVAVEQHYATGLTRPNIERALVDAGKDPARLVPADLVMLEDFHTMGRLATAALAELAHPSSADRVLDAGTGIGGAARFLAGEMGCRSDRIRRHGDGRTAGGAAKSPRAAGVRSRPAAQGGEPR
jgi:hypothetical protein